MNIGKLKPLVNNLALWEDFKSYVEEQIDLSHKVVERSTQWEQVLREQGRIALLRKLLTLRDEVNKPDGRQTSLFE